MTRNIDRDGLGDALADQAHLSSPPNLGAPTRSRSLPASKLPPHVESWNTKDLPWRVTSDFTAAACASGLVSPFIAIIDRAIIERASSRCTLRASLLSSFTNLLFAPHRFLTSKPALLVSALYFGTYLTANTVDTCKSTIADRPASATTSGPTKFAATSTVNMSLCLLKDSQFAKMFGGAAAGAGAGPRAVPMASYALFALRDSMTIFASFNLPPIIAPLLPMTGELERQVGRANVAQFLAPAGIQLLSTPLHLWGLDLYNRPNAAGNVVGIASRVRRVGRDWLGSSAARMARVIPAFGIGGVVNAGVRRRMMDLRGE